MTHLAAHNGFGLDFYHTNHNNTERDECKLLELFLKLSPITMITNQIIIACPFQCLAFKYKVMRDSTSNSITIDTNGHFGL